MKSKIYTDQIVGSIVQDGINHAEQLKADRIVEIIQIATEKEAYARTALSEGLQCVENVRDFISNPEAILGNMATKHGEIAEHVEVEIRNGRDILNYINPSATFEGVGRTAPEDYLIGDSQVQSKFINGAAKSLDHVIEHLHKYPGFTDGGYYHIPKDQFEILQKIVDGEKISELSATTIKKCQETILKIEQETGKSFSEVVRPGLSTYKEVQFGEVDNTLDGYEREFHETSREKIEKIREERANKENQTNHITDPSWGEALRYSAISAVISGTASASVKIYAKIKNGKKITEFELSDWKEVGYDFGKALVKGGVSGLSIYGLTKVVGMNAPFASAIVTTSMGLSSLYSDYKKGNISQIEYSDAACSLSVEAGIAAIGSALGQTVIPIPILGAIVGSAVAKATLDITKYVMGKKETAFVKQLQDEYNSLVSQLDNECKDIIAKIDEYFDKLGGLIDATLNPDLNIRLYGSIKLCQYLKVPEKEIFHSVSEFDDFMMR